MQEETSRAEEMRPYKRLHEDPEGWLQERIDFYEFLTGKRPRQVTCSYILRRELLAQLVNRGKPTFAKEVRERFKKELAEDEGGFKMTACCGIEIRVEKECPREQLVFQ